jgi:hypothetical protein
MNGLEEVTNAFGLGAGQEQIEWTIEVPEGIARMQLYFQHKWDNPGAKGPAQTVDSVTVLTGHTGLKSGDKIPVQFWWA